MSFGRRVILFSDSVERLAAGIAHGSRPYLVVEAATPTYTRSLTLSTRSENYYLVRSIACLKTNIIISKVI